MREDIVGARKAAKLIGVAHADTFKRWAMENGVHPTKVGLAKKKKHHRWRVADILRAKEAETVLPAGTTNAVLPGIVPECGWLGW